VSELPAWQEGAILSALDAIGRLHKRVLAASLLLFGLSLSPAHADEAVTAPVTNRTSLTGPNHFQETDGEALYRAACQSCHMADAQGGAGAANFPALAKNEKLSFAAYPLSMVLHGNKAMPGFKNMMSDAQVAAVVGYVRTHFGNDYKDAPTPDEVKAVRDAGK
jgi:mono/diheme cytochrome c family protein